MNEDAGPGTGPPPLSQWLAWMGVALVVLSVYGVYWHLTGHRSHHPPSNRCLSQVKQLATGTLIYSADNDDRLPPDRAWIDVTLRHTKSRDLYRCPVVAEEFPKGYGYAFDSRLSCRRFVEIESPERKTMLYDSTNLRRNATDPFKSLPNPPRHEGRGAPFNNVAYADTHVRAVRGLP